MQRLILDFLGRRWWILALLALFSAFGIATETPLVVTPFLLVALLFDANRGLIRTVRPLPVRRMEQAGAWWFLGVLVMPLVTLVSHPIGALIHDTTRKPRMIPIPSSDPALPQNFMLAPDYFSPWFVAVVATWLGLGYAAFSYLLCTALPTRPASTPLETVWQSIVGALWGLSMSAPMLIMFILPKNPGAVGPWHWIVFALVPGLVLLSWLAAPDMADRRMFALQAGRKLAAAPAASEQGGLTGIPLFLSITAGRTLLLLTFIFLVQVFVTRVMERGRGSDDTSFIAVQMVVFAIAFSAVPGSMIGMRMLRVLPLSAAKLAALLLAIPIALGFASGIFLSVAGGASDPSISILMNVLARILIVAGMGGLALAASLHIASGARIVMVSLVAIASAVALLFFAKIAPWLLLGGSVALVAAYLLLVSGLRRSNAFYQPRTFFGVTPGQPLSTR